MKTGPRKGIEELIENGDLEGLLRKAGELHGHFCPYLAYGIRAGYIAMRSLGIRSAGMEKVIAIIETNSCFSDGIQMSTGCTFGNNALIYKDLGKTAVTVARRDGKAIRIALNPELQDSFPTRYPEAHELFQKIVVRKEDTAEEDSERMMHLWSEASFRELRLPEKMLFKIEPRVISLPPPAPIFASVRCSLCGENVMETRARLKEGKPVCMECAGAECYLMDGKGISTQKGGKKR